MNEKYEHCMHGFPASHCIRQGEIRAAERAAMEPEDRRYRLAENWSHDLKDGPHPDGAVLRWVVEVPGPAYTIDLEAVGREIWNLTLTMPPAPPGQSQPSPAHMKWMGKQVLNVPDLSNEDGLSASQIRALVDEHRALEAGKEQT